MIKDNEKLLTASKVAQELDISTKTLNNWYMWYYDDTIEKPKNFPKLPDFIQEYPKGPRYWTIEDVVQLKKFQAWRPTGRAGVMGRVSEKYYGTKRYAKKETKDEG
ncbi:MAG: hypothetical protein J6V44_15530 [Methanobrevibacter sp.]|nr:hypothetical protein [Methanobrevibacter sp.]MBO7692120.1 hypothetical protein [Methanobrevibacter sp.]